MVRRWVAFILLVGLSACETMVMPPAGDPSPIDGDYRMMILNPPSTEAICLSITNGRVVSFSEDCDAPSADILENQPAEIDGDDVSFSFLASATDGSVSFTFEFELKLLANGILMGKVRGTNHNDGSVAVNEIRLDPA